MWIIKFSQNKRSNDIISSNEITKLVCSFYHINLPNDKRYKCFSGWGIECEILAPQQCQEKCPILSTEGLLGGLWIPKDGVADPVQICDTLIKEASSLGVRIIEQCSVTEIIQENGCVSAVNTTKGINNFVKTR